MEYCRRRQLQLGCSVVWVNAQSEATLLQSFREIAKVIDDAATDPIIATKSWISRQSRLFCVFDNVTSIDRIISFLPERDHEVLITTRDSALVGSEIVPFGPEVSLLDKHDAIALFILNCNIWTIEQQRIITSDVKKVLGKDTGTSQIDNIRTALKSRLNIKSTSELDDMVRFTEGLPLAIVQSASYLRVYRIPFAHYLRKLKAKAPEIRRGFFAHRMPGAQYTESIMTTWKATVEELEGTMPSAVRLLTLFAFLARTHIDSEFLSSVLKDYRFWQRRASLQLSADLTRFFSILDSEGNHFHEGLGRLQSLSLITNDNARAKMFIHPTIHEYIHLSMSADEAAVWLTRTIRILTHRLPPLLYCPSDNMAPSDSDSVLIHLERVQELMELYLDQMKDLDPDCALFFVETYLWYRGNEYLDIAERLIACTQTSHQGWLKEAVLAARLLDCIVTFQAAEETDLDLGKFRHYKNLYEEMHHGDYVFSDIGGSCRIMLLAVLTYRLDRATWSRDEVFPMAKSVPSFSWQHTPLKILNTSPRHNTIDGISLAVILRYSTTGQLHKNLFRAFNRHREGALLATQFKCSEIDGYFRLMFNIWRSSIHSKAQAIELIEAIRYVQRHKVMKSGELDAAIESLNTMASEPEVTVFVNSIAADPFFFPKILRSELFGSLEQWQGWLQCRLPLLESRAERFQIQIREVRTQLVEIAAMSGQLQPDDTASENSPNWDLKRRIRKALLKGGDKQGALTFCKNIISTYLDPDKVVDRDIVSQWIGELYSLSYELSPRTALHEIILLLLPSWEMNDHTLRMSNDGTLQMLDFWGEQIFHLVTMSNRDFDPISLRQFCSSIRYYLEVSEDISDSRKISWVEHVEYTDLVLGVYGNRDLTHSESPNQVLESLRISKRILRSSSYHEKILAKLIQSGFDSEAIPKSMSARITDGISLETVSQPTFKAVPPALVLGETSNITASFVVDPRCGLWFIEDPQPSRAILLWTRSNDKGFFYIDVSPRTKLQQIKAGFHCYCKLMHGLWTWSTANLYASNSRIDLRPFDPPSMHLFMRIQFQYP